MVGDRELYNTAAELTRIMGHKNAAPFFNDPAAINPQTGQLLHPPPTPPAPPPDPKLVAAQARAQLDQATAAHRAQLDQQRAQNDAIHLQVKTQGEIELAKVKADLDAKMTVLEAHRKAAIEAGKVQRSYPPGARQAKDGHHYVPDASDPANICWCFTVSDYSLVPVEPDFENVALVPVEHDPFVDDGVTQQAQSQQALTQPVQPPDQPPQQPTAGVARLYVGRPANNTQASEVGESWSPDTESSDAPGPSRAAASTPAQDKPVYDSSQFNQPFGELKPWTPTPTQRIGYLAADGLMALGMKPYTANDWATRLGNLLGLIPPIGAAGSALDLIDAKRRDDFPGVLTAALGMIPGARGIARGAAGEAGAGLRALLRRSPASRAAEKGYFGIGTTPNGGPTHVGTDHLYPAGEGQRSVVPVPLTGSRRKDEKLANELGGFTDTPEGYLWHHVDDFDPKSGNATLELVKKGAHNATLPHAGSVAQ